MSERHGNAGFLLNEKDFTGIGDSFIHDMHIGAYAQAYILSHSRLGSAMKVLCNDHKDAFPRF